MQDKFVNKIFDTNISFKKKALEVFQYQFEHSGFYRDWCSALHIRVSAIDSIEKIPFLPISFFKSKKIISDNNPAEIVFESSGTTLSVPSRHYVRDVSVYKTSYKKAFNFFYGDIKDYCVLALLPSYKERENSSLVYMMDDLIKESNHPLSGYYLYDFDALAKTLEQLESSQQKTLLIGVSFALLDFAQSHQLSLHHTIVMETGGMKGRKKEITREELHAILKERLGVDAIHSEYGMTELLSQAYSKTGGIFTCPPWMKVLVRDEQDPLSVKTSGTGVINIIDLANIYSSSFIATDDVGIINEDGSFIMKGRLDAGDLRGCNLLVV